MRFHDVMRWVLSSTPEDRLALEELLAFIRVRDVDRAPARNIKVPGPVRGFSTEMQVLNRDGVAVENLKPGQYTAKIVNVTGEPYEARATMKVKKVVAVRAAAYTPKNAFGRKWWAKLQNATQPFTPQQLAVAVGKPQLHGQVSSTLGNLFQRGVVTRLKKGNAFTYSVVKGEKP